ncbi:hypothetical protein FIM1_2527 [Kluyveromyces marxianus]|uniref:Uncharacterized protein n=1 Tax=Kluyveromyces marxianus TaxID=4911 RepID=A0ABX6EVJ4_KLUMA|nr:hypothetical protein FIM1_2527 [Kluyveromyces marxianus]
MSLSTFIKVDDPVKSASVSYAFSHGANSPSNSILSLDESQIINVSASTFSAKPTHSVVLAPSSVSGSGAVSGSADASIVPSSNPNGTSLPSSLITDTTTSLASAAASGAASSVTLTSTATSSSKNSSASGSKNSSSTSKNGAAAGAVAGPWKPAFAFSLLCLVPAAAALI